MSSIAYVTDEKMIEYHRLCGSRTINFWRLSSKKEFTDFRKGDLLFFYARAGRSREKGFVGYAHFDSMHKLSLRQMWKRYGRMNGYDTMAALQDAIARAAKEKTIPPQMNCLYLKDVVFFMSAVYPSDIGLSISSSLESYCYLDQEDPQATVRILKQAEKNGIDLWSAAQNAEPQNIFRRDEIRHQLAVICRSIGKSGATESESAHARRLARMQSAQANWELIRGSHTDCVQIDLDAIILALPFAAQAKDREARIAELIGRLTMYRLGLRRSGLNLQIHCQVLGEELPAELTALLEELNHD